MRKEINIRLKTGKGIIICDKCKKEFEVRLVAEIFMNFKCPHCGTSNQAMGEYKKLKEE